MPTNDEIYQHFKQIAEEVADGNEALSVWMDRLREAIGAGRLAAGPVAQITYNLERHGLGSAPSSLPTNSGASVLLYKKDTPLGRVIAAAAGTDPDSASQLRSALAEMGKGAMSREEVEELEGLRDTLNQVRALLGVS
jgi:hypothetical protein